MAKISIPVLMLFGFAGFALYANTAVKLDNLDIDIYGLDINRKKTDFQNVTIVFKLKVFNPNKTAVTITAIDANIDYDGSRAGIVSIKQPFNVKAGQSSVITIEAKLKSTSLANAILSILTKKASKEITIKGVVKADGLTSPFIKSLKF